MAQELEAIFQKHKRERSSLISVLQEVQYKLGYLSPEAIAEIARFLKISESEIYGVATFYAQFRFTRPGEHEIKVCLGTACHVRGGERILEEMERELDIQAGGVTPDYKFSLEKVACFGSCALAPVMVVGKEVHGRMDPNRAKKIIRALR
ncbi:MAG: NADH-quinone oxidoreductase subunit NuoE [Chloroflexi bacterium]|nr:NADH-quinone oxidoreductase subunit NuoE [Chloroflexota bacterium]